MSKRIDAYEAFDGKIFRSEMACNLYEEEQREHMNASIEAQVSKYINDPNTKVFLLHNNDLGRWMWSVVVEGSGDFWLDSFESRDEAYAYIESNNLNMSRVVDNKWISSD